MKWMLFAGVGLVALVALVAVVGSMLPREHKASRTLRVKRAPEEIWPVLTQVTSASGIPVDVVENAPPHRLVTRVKDSEKMFGGTWTIVISPDAGASAVTITEDGWVGNPIFRFMSRFVIGHYATLDGTLKAVAKHFNEEPALSGE